MTCLNSRNPYVNVEIIFPSRNIVRQRSANLQPNVSIEVAPAESKRILDITIGSDTLPTLEQRTSITSLRPLYVQGAKANMRMQSCIPGDVAKGNGGTRLGEQAMGDINTLLQSFKNAFLSRNLNQNMQKMCIFWKKIPKSPQRAPLPTPRVVTPAN